MFFFSITLKWKFYEIMPKPLFTTLTYCILNLLHQTSLREEFRDDVCLFDMLLSHEFVKFSQINGMGFITVNEEWVEAASGKGGDLNSCFF